MIEKILSPLTDIIFKLLMGTEHSIEILTDFLLSVLNLSPDEYTGVSITNPFLMQEYKGDKLGILDVKLKLKSGKIINIEIQVDPAPYMESRILFYASKMVTEQMGEGDKYDSIKRVISIVITGHMLIRHSDNFHHHFRLCDMERGVALTDALEIHTLEVPKIRTLSGDVENSQLLNWMKFFDAKTEEELNVLAEKNPVMKKATIRLMELSADEKARQLYEARLKERRDNDTREHWAVNQAKLEFARNLIADGVTNEKIAIYTGLAHDEIENLRTATVG